MDIALLNHARCEKPFTLVCCIPKIVIFFFCSLKACCCAIVAVSWRWERIVLAWHLNQPLQDLWVPAWISHLQGVSALSQSLTSAVDTEFQLKSILDPLLTNYLSLRLGFWSMQHSAAFGGQSDVDPPEGSGSCNRCYLLAMLLLPLCAALCCVVLCCVDKDEKQFGSSHGLY